ncbi:hypothetical protein HPP92_025582 [Vanilla planifolia]|uniref:Rhodanese domain-containing protein n=1 Tax=Vanilla planifolia TaxID=51239 RepID=A0A835U952_VANPL|nr:hypothetical protein HPP92_025582 [Vanilla planifolia]
MLKATFVISSSEMSNVGKQGGEARRGDVAYQLERIWSISVLKILPDLELVTQIQEFLKDIDGEFLKIIHCTEDMLAQSIWDAVHCEQPNLKDVKGEGSMGVRTKMALRISYITPSELISMRRVSKVAIVDVRDEERSYDAHIAGSHHYASGNFSGECLILWEALKGKTQPFSIAHSARFLSLVFGPHYAILQPDNSNASMLALAVRGPTCAQMFVDYLSKKSEDAGIREVVILERGFNGWKASGREVCSCMDNPCKAEAA